MKMPSVMVATGSSLGCLSMNQPSALQEMPNKLATSFGVVARLQTGGEDDHIHRDAALLADQGIFHLDDQLAFFTGQAGSIRDFGYFTADEQGAFFQDALVELIVGLVGGAHIDVELVDGRAGALLDQVGKLQSLHAADRRAVVVVVPIAAADAVDDADRFRHCHAIAQDDIAVGRTGGIGQTFEFQAGEDVRQAPITILGDPAGVEQIVAGGQDDIANLDGDDLVFLGEIDGIGRAEFLTGFAGAFLEVGAVWLVDDRVFRDSLREGGVDGFAVAQPGFVDIVDDFLGAFFLADATAGADCFVDIAGFLPDGDGEVAHIAIDLFHFALGVQLDIRVVASGHHLGGQDAGGAVQGGEGLVELGHMPADGWFSLDQVDRETGVGDLERGLDAGNATADHQGGRVDGHVQRLERLVVDDPLDTARDDRLGFFGGGDFIGVHPGDLLADGDQLAQVGVQIGFLAGGAEGLFVQVRRTSGHDHAGQTHVL